MRVIEFLGMPRSGKSTQIALLKAHFEKTKTHVTVISDREIEKEIKIPISNAYEYNMAFFNKIFSKLMAEKKRNTDIVILDRGFYDAMAWFISEFKMKHISKEELDQAENYFSSLKQIVDIAVMLTIDTKTSIKRHEEKGEVGTSEDYVLQEEYFNNLFRTYKQLENDYSKDEKVIILEGSETIDALKEKIMKNIPQ